MFASAGHPADIKRRFCPKGADWSKLTLQRSVCAAIRGFEEKIKTMPKTKREHVSDATAHGVLTAEHLDELVRAAGGLG
jgi:hypothetical protein